MATTSLTEIVALLVKQTHTLDWAYLFEKTNGYWLGYRLQQIIQTINHEANGLLNPPPFWEQKKTMPVPDNLTVNPDSVREVLRPYVQLA
ncbi:hypothetical protein QUF63_12100 [Anaerolineales bacterium HSG25]|nr:hypothetical protein [Anaerolineales bacterium HSG25]